MITLVQKEMFDFLECLAALWLKTLVLIPIDLVVQQTLLLDDLGHSVPIL